MGPKLTKFCMVDYLSETEISSTTKKPLDKKEIFTVCVLTLTFLDGKINEKKKKKLLRGFE